MHCHTLLQEILRGRSQIQSEEPPRSGGFTWNAWLWLLGCWEGTHSFTRGVDLCTIPGMLGWQRRREGDGAPNWGGWKPMFACLKPHTSQFPKGMHHHQLALWPHVQTLGFHSSRTRPRFRDPGPSTPLGKLVPNPGSQLLLSAHASPPLGRVRGGEALLTESQWRGRMG